MKISYKVLFAAVLSIAGTNAFAADVTGLATTNYVKGAINSLDSTVATGVGAIDTITQTDGKITATTRRTLKNADIATDAAIATSKISGLDAALSGKQTTGNLVDTTDKIEANKTSTTKYPSMAVAQQIAATAATGVATDVASDITELQNSIDSLKDTVDQNKGAADDAIKGLTGIGTGTTAGNGMVKTVTQANGVVTATRGLVATADIADGAVDGKKIKDGAIAAGSNIKVTKDATTGVVTVANTYSYTLPSAGTALGGVKTGGDITATSGTLTITDGKVTGKKIASDAIKGSGSVTVSKDATTGVITVSGTDTKYTLPTATTSVLGGVKSSAVVTATDGVLGIGSEQITSGMIKNGEVKEADIGAQAVSTAKIKSPTATECASGNCALVDLGTGAQWLPIVNEYN